MIKLLSFKFVIFLITCVLRICGIVGNVEWLTVTGIVLGTHAGMKGLHSVIDKKHEDECGG